MKKTLLFLALALSSCSKPTNEMEWMMRAEILRDKGNVDGAIEAYTEAIALSPRSQYYQGRASLWLRKGQLSKAMPDAEEALRQQPHLGTYVVRGEVYRAMGNKHEAADDFRKALACIRPGDTSIWATDWKTKLDRDIEALTK